MQTLEITNEEKLQCASQYVSYIRSLACRKASREQEIESLRNTLGSTLSTLGIRISKSPSPDAIPNTVIRLDAIIATYEMELAEYVQGLEQFIQAIDQLEPLHAQVLTLHYVDGLEYLEVAERIGYNISHVYRLRAAALIALYDVMPYEWRFAKDDS